MRYVRGAGGGGGGRGRAKLTGVWEGPGVGARASSCLLFADLGLLRQHALQLLHEAVEGVADALCGGAGPHDGTVGCAMVSAGTRVL